VEAPKKVGMFDKYSVRADLSEGASLKIVIKAVKPEMYQCFNRDSSSPPCVAIFYEWHEICPECGGVNTIRSIGANRCWGWNLGSNSNWLVDYVGYPFTCTVYESGKWADAAIDLFCDFFIEYYENGATEPTKVKVVKVID